MRIVAHSLVVVLALGVALPCDILSQVMVDSTRLSAVRVQVANTGVIGMDLANVAHALEWPRGSRNMFLFGGGIWVGAKVEVQKNDGSFVKDSIVFQAYNPNNGRSWSNPRSPVRYTVEQDREILSWEFDDQLVSLYDGSEEHRRSEGFPLGLHIEQAMTGWLSGAFEHALAVKTTITNTNSHTLEDVAVGWVLDIDIGPADLGGSIRYNEKITVLRDSPQAVLRIHDTLNPEVGAIGIAFPQTPNKDGIRGFSNWDGGLEPLHRYEHLTRSTIESHSAFRDIKPVACLSPQDIGPGQSLDFTILFLFEEDTSQASDVHMLELVDRYMHSTSAVESSSAQTLSVFPNPTNGATAVQLDHPFGYAHVSIVDLLGRVRTQAHLDTSRVSVAALEPGTYFIVVRSETATMRARIQVSQ